MNRPVRLFRRRAMATVEWIILVIVFGLGLAAGAWLLRNTLVDEYAAMKTAIQNVDLQQCLTKEPPPTP